MQISRRRRLYFTDDPSQLMQPAISYFTKTLELDQILVLSFPLPGGRISIGKSQKFLNTAKLVTTKTVSSQKDMPVFHLRVGIFFFSITSLKNFDVKLISCGGVNYSLAATVFLSLKIVCILFSLRFLFYKQTR